MDFLIIYSIPLSIFLRIISCILLLFFCIPLQVKEAAVKNGLRLLRLQLLAFGVILLLTNLFSLAFLVLALDTPQKPINAMLQIMNAVAFLGLAFIGNRMYHAQYSEESKEHHKQISKLEHEEEATPLK